MLLIMDIIEAISNNVMSDAQQMFDDDMQQQHLLQCYSFVAAKCAHTIGSLQICHACCTSQSPLVLQFGQCTLQSLMGDMGMQVELFAEAVAGKAINAGWQSLSKDVLPEPDANQLFAMPG